ncbi:uncharacterized protein TM35_000461050 [Trypanosoma theileri]|uniref:Uncharacterized protein n=1 Tax=Trypanosoma theileri TaxID=67003 RepID=A0A1X0NHX1_9TRYP|nr:uncharacterized protein TM35_000461050 [Trypanosoma theileri]ORC84286.1 hypothetical protein TM35_000461050 [Trypanosoma theileri]
MAIALDSEFLKTHGVVLTRSVAFVPFSFVRETTGISQQKQQIPKCKTSFGNPFVLSISPKEVMCRADLLPCGHSLNSIVQSSVVSGEKLKNIQEEYKQLKSKTTTESFEEKEYTENNNYSSLTDFDSLCPHSIPNIRRLDKAWVESVYMAPVNSLEFRDAAMQLNHLRAYGKGRRRQRALPFLLRYHPKLLQDILRSSFPSANAWCSWLTMCGDLVERELQKLGDEHRQLSDVCTFENSQGKLDDKKKGNFPQYKECNTLEEFSYELNRTWSSLMVSVSSGGSKFYCYGDGDLKAIQNTLQLSCKMLERHSSSITKKTQSVNTKTFNHQQNGFEEGEDGKKEVLLGSGAGCGTVDTGRLLTSPHQARPLDATRHPLFAAAGFRTSPGAIPALTEALKKAALADETAVRLLKENAPHNPVWDARALACVCASCGIGPP